jgi:hypothetical protein
MPRPPLLNSDQQAAARARYLSDPSLSVEDVAAEFGVGRTVMLRYLAGFTRPQGGRRKPVPTSRIRSLKRQGLTADQIGARVGLSRAGVYVRLGEGLHG